MKASATRCGACGGFRENGVCEFCSSRVARREARQRKSGSGQTAGLTYRHQIASDFYAGKKGR